MSIKSIFLTLSMREQICLTILFLSLFSVAVILCIIGSLSYEILKENYKYKKIFIYNIYKEYIESCFYFQSFNLLQYEELIKRSQKQIWAFYETLIIYSDILRQNYDVREEYIYGNSIKLFLDINSNNEITKNQSGNEILYIFLYNRDKFFEFFIKSYFGRDDINVDAFDEETKTLMIETYWFLYFKLFYNSISSLIISNNIESKFGLPGFDVPITSEVIFVYMDRYIMFSFNYSKIYSSLVDIFGNYSNFNDSSIIDNYYNKKKEEIITYVYKMLSKFENNELFLFTYLFGEVYEEIIGNEMYLSFNKTDNSTYYKFIEATLGHYSSINYENNKFSLLANASDGFYYAETNIIENYLFYMNNKISKNLNISFIPLYSENDTIISPELCVSFILKQLDYQINEDGINELYKKIIKGKSTIKDCFINNNIKVINEQLEIKEILNTNFSFFMSVSNLIEQGIMFNDKNSYYFVKYTYPNFNSLVDFNTDYLLLDQINFYIFAPFKQIYQYKEMAFNINLNIFYIIIIITFYIWVLSLCVNLIIFNKVIVKLTNPIKRLQEAIESSSIKDENIFHYEYDDFINDLFLTSKELLTGQIEYGDNRKELKQFNIISKSNGIKNIDKNLYQRNLIINNDILNQLISEQQNMLDFSKNIKINEGLELNQKNDKNNEDFISEKQINNIIHYNTSVIGNRIDEEDNDIDNKSENKQKKTKEDEDREPYKKLFQIAEYLYYHQNKVENNYIHIINDEIKDDSKKSKISKINSNLNINSSLTKNQLKKSGIKREFMSKNDDSENISINMINNTNISYLWYMEAKKKKNTSINYKISNNNYNELFMDDNIYQNHNQSIQQQN